MGTEIGNLVKLAETPAPTDLFVVVDQSEAADADKTKHVEYQDVVTGSGGGDILATIPCTLEVAQGIGAYGNYHPLATQVSKISGWVMPTDVDSILNFKFICPENLAGTPALIIRVHTLTLSANTTDAINLTLDMRYTGDGVNTDQAFNQTVVATNYNVSDTIETHDYHDITPTNSPSAGDLVTGQIFRDISLDVAGDVQIVGISAIILRSAV